MVPKKTIKLFQTILSMAAPPKPLSVGEWAAEYRYIPDEYGAHPGKWSSDTAAYQKEPMDAFTNPGVKKVIAMFAAQLGKALDIYTPIPTPEGWKFMKDLQKGDAVFDENGHICHVVWATNIMENHPCYRITFSDGASIIADAEHQWMVHTLDQNQKELVMTTDEIADTYKTTNGRRNRYYIPVAKALETKTVVLPISPYTLGYWLGDGNSYSAQITVPRKDLEIAEHIKAEGHNIVIRNIQKDKPDVLNLQIDPRRNDDICIRGHDMNVVGRTVKGYCAECMRQLALRSKWRGIKEIHVDPVINPRNTLHSKLKQLGLINNKHIPAEYLRAGREQRMELLRGLMDSDGSIGKDGSCEITFKSEQLIHDAFELMVSLGFKPTLHKKHAVCTNSPVKAESEVYRLTFTAYKENPIFHLARKRERLNSKDGYGIRSYEVLRRVITLVERVDSRPVKCIGVDSPRHLYLAGDHMIPTHNSELLFNVMGRYICIDPCPILFVQPTVDDAKDWSKERFTPTVFKTPALNKLIYQQKSRDTDNTILKKVFPGGYLAMVGSNAPSGLAKRSIKVLLCDEVDRFAKSAGTEGDPVELAIKRTSNFWDAKIGMFSTPTDEASRIYREYMLGSQKVWKHQCPNCKEWHWLDLDDMQYDYDVFTVKERKSYHVRRVVWRCPNCGMEFTEAQMKAAPQAYIADNPDIKDVESFHVNAFSSPWLDWSTLIGEYLVSKEDPVTLKTFVNTRLAEVYRPLGQMKDIASLIGRREFYEAEVPDGVLLLTAAVDVQNNRLEYEICGWGEGEESWGIRKGIIPGVPDQEATWNALDEVLDRTYHFKDGSGIMVQRTFIDSGGSYTDAVYDYCSRNVNKQRFAIKGASEFNVPVIYKTATAKNYDNLLLLLLGVSQAKQYIFQRLSIQEYGPGYMHFPNNEGRGYDETYFKGLLSEQLEQKLVKGKLVSVWVNIAKDHRNEPLDLKNYNLACIKSISPDWERYKRIHEGVFEPKKAQKRPSYGCFSKGGVW